MITQDDVLYMIVTDRFANGDPTNDGAVDRGALERRHGGDLLGIVERMPYLHGLGVTALWITPVYLNPPDAYHGYHPLDFERVDPHLCSRSLGPIGSRDTVRRFVEIAHEHGLKVILDLIVNHTAPGHPWLKERPHWYNPNLPTPEKVWLWGLPDLNHDNIDLNDYFTRNVLEWLELTGADGARIDAARHVETAFWEMFKLFAHGFLPNVTLIGEVWDQDVAQVAPYQAYHGFDSMFDFPLYHAILDVFVHDRGFGRIARPELSEDEPQGVLNQDKAYRNAYQLITFLGNHDTPRIFYQAGGPARAEEALARTKLALSFLFTTRGIPQLYYGDEIALDGGPHPDNRRDMPWAILDAPDPTDPSDRSDPSGSASARAHAMLAYTRDLIRLRRSSMALRYGTLVTLYQTPTFYAFARIYPDDLRVVALNNSPEPADVTIPLRANPRLSTALHNRLHDGIAWVNDLPPGDRPRITDGSLRVRLPARAGGVYRIADGSGESASDPPLDTSQIMGRAPQRVRRRGE